MKSWNWALTAEVLGITFLIMGDAAAFWSANNPSFFTVRHFRRKDGPEATQTARDIRIGGLAGSAIALTVGFGGSLVTKNWWPITGALGMLAFQWAVWEYALANPHSNAESM